MATIRIVNDQLPGVPARARRAVRRGLETIADQMAQAARNRVPVRTGALLESIEGRVVESAGDTLHAEVSADTEYAAFVEFGTSRMPARPFLTPAVEAYRGEVATILANDLGAELGRGG